MTIIQAILLGIIQGATEFIPVSSSGHLVLVPWLLGWNPPGLAFDTMLHWGTLLAVGAYFWRDFWAMLTAWLRGLRNRDWSDPHARLGWWLILGSIPAALAGVFLEDFFESLFLEPVWAALFLLVTAVLMVLGEWLGRQGRSLEKIGWADAMIIGIAQALAIAPGISRSGSTISAGLLRDLDRPAAARFSFLLGTPAILGAGLLQMDDLLSEVGQTGIAPLILGLIVAAVVGYLCIWGLLRYLKGHRLYVFAAYCAVVGLICLLVALTG